MPRYSLRTLLLFATVEAAGMVFIWLAAPAILGDHPSLTFLAVLFAIAAVLGVIHILQFVRT